MLLSTGEAALCVSQAVTRWRILEHFRDLGAHGFHKHNSGLLSPAAGEENETLGLVCVYN